MILLAHPVLMLQAQEKHLNGPQSLFTQWKTIKILLRSKLFKRLTLCIMLTGIIQEGLQDLMIQYLQLKLDFGIGDQVCKHVACSGWGGGLELAPGVWGWAGGGEGAGHVLQGRVVGMLCEGCKLICAAVLWQFECMLFAMKCIMCYV